MGVLLNYSQTLKSSSKLNTVTTLVKSLKYSNKCIGVYAKYIAVVQSSSSFTYILLHLRFI